MKNRVIKLDKDVILEHQWIPPGESLMGSPESEKGHEVSESPQHNVQFKQGFWMGKYPVTQQQWQAVMGSNPSKFVDPRQPVEMVSWVDAQEFINRLNELHHGHFHLPTEAQWEYACRAGTTTPFSCSCNGGEQVLDRAAWYNVNSGGHPHQVGEKEPNAFGLHDMHGNVFEWTADWYGSYSSDEAVDPAGPSTGDKKVLRGGCCLCDALNCRAANRYEKAPDGKNYNIGFRVVILPESDDKGTQNKTDQGEKTVKKIQIYDPPMCCSTGVCGPSVDEKLVRFSADLDWLKGQGLTVERYNLSQQPGEFVKNSQVKVMLEKEGNDCLPIIFFDGAVVHKNSYPARNELAALVGLSVTNTQKLMNAEVCELVAIGAAIACNCEPCLKYHYDKARKLGVTKEDMLLAVQTAQMVKDSPAKAISELAAKYLDKKDTEVKNNAACGPGCCC